MITIIVTWYKHQKKKAVSVSVLSHVERAGWRRVGLLVKGVRETGVKRVGWKRGVRMIYHNQVAALGPVGPSSLTVKAKNG